MIVTAKCSAGVVYLATVLFLHLSFSDYNGSLDSNLGHTHYVGLLCDSLSLPINLIKILEKS